MASLEILSLYIRDRLKIFGEEGTDGHLVFGAYLLQTWHFNCLGIVYLFLQTVIWYLKSLESARTTALFEVEPASKGSSWSLDSHMQFALFTSRSLECDTPRNSK